MNAHRTPRRILRERCENRQDFIEFKYVMSMGDVVGGIGYSDDNLTGAGTGGQALSEYLESVNLILVKIQYLHYHPKTLPSPPSLPAHFPRSSSNRFTIEIFCGRFEALVKVIKPILNYPHYQRR